MARDLSCFNLLSARLAWVALKGERQRSLQFLFTDQCSSGFSYVDNSIACHEMLRCSLGKFITQLHASVSSPGALESLC